MTSSLVADIEAGNLRKAIPYDTYLQSLETTFTELEAEYPEWKSTQFDPEKHLCYYAGNPLDHHKYDTTRRLTMEELGLTNKHQISPIGVSDAFPLFTDEAVAIMKLECLQKETFLKYARTSYNSTSGLDCVIRGYVKLKDHVTSPFIYAAWKHPKTLDLISTMAGVELEVVMDYEIAHVNVGITPENVAEQQRADAQAENAGDDIPAIVGWHYDSYPFVCVLMISDTTNMIGGETYLRMGNDEVAQVSGPQRGSAAVLQGRFIEHLAHKPLGASERITMVTSFRAKDPKLYDGSILSTVKPEINFGSMYDDFYSQWVQYRCDVLKSRLDDVSKCVQNTEKFSKIDMKQQLLEIEKYLRKTYEEMEVTPAEWEAIKMKG